jgi:flagellar basal body-associated protein FliL
LNETGRLRWVWVVLIVAAAYLVSGLVSAALSRAAASSQGRQAWRLGAWVISAVAFAVHIRYEHIRLRSTPRTVAFHVALAVALAGFGLAVSASLHGRATNHPFPATALLIWPVLTALPAFIVALVVAVVLSRARHIA